VAWLILLSKLGTLVFVAYLISAGRRITARGTIAFFLALGGGLAFVAGFGLGAFEDARGRDGRVVSGVVIEKLSSSGSAGSRQIGRLRGRNQAVRRNVVTAKGFAFYETLARIVTTGAPAAWVVDYRFPCAAGPACFGRDFVTMELWSRLQEGQPVNVRQARGETVTSRLDDNPQWGIAIAELGIGAILLFAAALVSGRLVLFRRPAWITAPAVVTAVESVTYRDVVRWRIRFAYFDPEGVAQESADEVVVNAWKPGDSCLAVFQPNQPDLATMKPANG
jgi:hypothetical protein